MKRINRIKDKNIRIFYEVEVDGVLTKKYIHKKDTYLKAYVRQLAGFELNSSNAIMDGGEVEFLINYRDIKYDMFVEFRKKVYQIKGIDPFEFYKTDIKFRASEVSPKDYDVIEWS